MKKLIIILLLFSLKSSASMVEAIQNLEERSTTSQVFNKFGKPDKWFQSTEDENRIAFLYVIGDTNCGIEFERGIMFSNICKKVK